MTVIVWDNKTLASDSLLTDESGFSYGSIKKIYRLKSGAMMGMCGDADARAVIALLDNVKDENDLPSKAELEALKTDGGYLLVLPDKSCWDIEINAGEGGRYTAEVVKAGKEMAIGHGEKFARAALALGKSSEEAVRLACRFSITCALPVQAMKLEDKPKEKIKRIRKPKVEVNDQE